MQLIKQLVAHLPHKWQNELKRLHFSRTIKKGNFVADEPDFEVLDKFIEEEDWVIDIGANVGHYTNRLSQLVGKRGRVLAFEPVPTTFSLLAANSLLFPHPNVTLFNAAVSNKLDTVGMSIPNFNTGLENFYMAHLTNSSNSPFSVVTLSLDALNIENKVKLVKIDVEGHESFVLAGMKKLIERAKPVLIVETDSKEIIDELTNSGYKSERLEGSPNILFTPI